MKYRINVGVSTTKGNYRSQNEDNFLFDGNSMKDLEEEISICSKSNLPMLFALCDGIGGFGLGKEAADKAVDILKRNGECLAGTNKDETLEELDRLIKKVNLEVCLLEKQGKKAGCTLALTYISKELVYIANVGDSRIYRFTGQKLIQLSIDHNQAQDIVHFGLTQDKNNKKRNVLTQYMGMSPKEIIIEPHYDSFGFDNMILLLCSDGLSEVLSSEYMEEIITKYQNRNLKKASDYLIAKAIKLGAKDNLTAMLIKLY